MKTIYQEKVLILTPVKDAEVCLETYFKGLYRLAYPANLLSLGFLEGDSRDHTFTALQKRLPQLEQHFRVATIWKKDFGYRIPPGKLRWNAEIQIQRRSVLAKSRNYLLSRALNDEDWVLWLDVDVIDYPPDIVEKLLAAGKDIVHPNCVTHDGSSCYDLNAWRDRGKSNMNDLKKEGNLVKIHAVGGTMLLIRADLHREGLIFPTFPYGKRNRLIRKTNLFYPAQRGDPLRFWLDRVRGKYAGEIETEGLGIMAHDIGHECWGMPNLEIRHRDG
ncbi:MAG: hypothetical protein ACRENG_07960 [bacterium]